MARGRKAIGNQAMTVAERQRRRRSSETYRRALPVKIEWGEDAARIGRIIIGGEYWGAVEWSEKRQAWCIEDAEGRCLAHAESIHGQAPTKDEAIALARDMIRDGRLPSPEAARRCRLATRLERSAQRNAQPAQQRKREKQEQRDQELSNLRTAKWRAHMQEEQAPVLWEAFHEVFDFTDRDLWKSNSFAVLRPRLILHLRAIIARLECELADHRERASKTPFSMRATAEQKRRAAQQRREREDAAAAEVEIKLARTRDVLTAMEAA
jgi:hypothetical protein